MGVWLKGYRAVAVVFWVLAAVAVAVWGWSMPFPLGWDLHIYQTAVVSLRAGHDPYAEATAIRRAFHLHMAEHPDAQPPFSYIYSPITLPLLRVIGLLPFWLSETVYWAADIMGLVTMLWVGMQFVEERERKLFALLAPAVVFFPGLLQNVNLYSGNVAYIVYGLVLAAAVLGWRKGRWGWFYVVVLAASCFKGAVADAVGGSGVFGSEAVVCRGGDGRCGLRAVCSAAVDLAFAVSQLPGGRGAAVHVQPRL